MTATIGAWGGPAHAGHGVRPAAPLDGRSRRGSRRRLGLRARRHGRPCRRLPPRRRSQRRRGPDRPRPSPTSMSRAARVVGSRSPTAGSSARRSSSARPTPSAPFSQLVDRGELPDEFVAAIERFKLPRRRREDQPGARRTAAVLRRAGRRRAEGPTRGSIVLAVSPAYVQAAFDDAAAGRPAAHPIADVTFPSTSRHDADAPGMHCMSLFTQWVPDDWARGPHRDELEAYADRVIDDCAELAPNLKGAILARQVIGPYDMRARPRTSRRQCLRRRARGRPALPHAPGARLRRLPHADRAASTTVPPAPTAAAASAASPDGRPTVRR